MKNYSFGNSYKFTVSRASLTVKSNNSVVQYGTEISSNEAQVMEGVIPPANLQVTGKFYLQMRLHPPSLHYIRLRLR